MDIGPLPESLKVAAISGLIGSLSSGGRGGTNDAESHPVKITNAASRVAIAITPALITHPANPAPRSSSNSWSSAQAACSRSIGSGQRSQKLAYPRPRIA